jgi:hypothetical protein
MKRVAITLTEIIYCFSFLIYLGGSALALIEHGTELSLWIMFLAVMTSLTARTLPWLGVKWLRIEKKGAQLGWWLALILQFSSWGTFSGAMLFRLERDLPPFYRWITITTLLWASWLLIFIYSRHANPQTSPHQPLNQPINPVILTNEKDES